MFIYARVRTEAPEVLALFLVSLYLWKCSSTGLLHLGHLGCFFSSSDSKSITYMRHWGHPATTIGLSSSSDDTHELAGEPMETSALLAVWLMLGFLSSVKLAFMQSRGRRKRGSPLFSLVCESCGLWCTLYNGFERKRTSQNWSFLDFLKQTRD